MKTFCKKNIKKKVLSVSLLSAFAFYCLCPNNFSFTPSAGGPDTLVLEQSGDSNPVVYKLASDQTATADQQIYEEEQIVTSGQSVSEDVIELVPDGTDNSGATIFKIANN